MKIYKLLAVSFVFMALLCNCSNDSSERYVTSADAADPTDPGVHAFTGLPLTEDGWTDFAALIQGDAAAAVQANYDDARVVFVSISEGDDSTGQIYSTLNITFDENGMFQPQGPVNAYRTIAAGVAQVRDGYPDILLFKRGDTWEGQIGNWTKSGPSSLQRIIIASYGQGDRPLFEVNDTAFGFSSYDNLIIFGLNFYNPNWQNDPQISGLAATSEDGAKDVLFEDCVLKGLRNVIHSFDYGVLYEGIAIRRTHFLEGPGEAHDGGFFSSHAKLLVEECIFSQIERNDGKGGRFIYSYNKPINGVPTVEIRGNIFFQSILTGLTLRAGGIIHNNLIIRNDRAQFGTSQAYDPDLRATGSFDHNVWLEWPIDSSGQGLNLQILNVDGVAVHDNIWSNRTESRGTAINIDGREYHIAKNISVHNNIVNGMADAGVVIRDVTDIENISIINNDLQLVTGGQVVAHTIETLAHFTYENNHYYSTRDPETNVLHLAWFRIGSTGIPFEDWVEGGVTNYQVKSKEYSDPQRTLASYNQNLQGAATTDAFMQEVLQQARYNWRSEYTACAVNNYIREGLDKETIECTFN